MSEAKKQRACMLCSQVKTYAQFRKDGCDNCEDVLGLRGNSDKIVDCTTTNFSGIVSMMDSKDSWVARWQRIERFTPGVYAIQVYGRLPEDVIGDLESRGSTCNMAFNASPFESKLVNTNAGRVDGVGSYRFTSSNLHGCSFEGPIVDGQFHGKGTITFPNNDKLFGVWNNGALESSSFQFADGLKYESSSWSYCKGADRRFQCEQDKIPPAGMSMALSRNS